MITGFVLIGVLGLLQAVLRMAFFGMMMSGNSVELEHDISTLESDFMAAMFGLLGIAGVLTSIGILLKTPWGYYGTLFFSAVTIAFDVWGVLAVQITAVMGFVFPALFIAYLLVKKEEYLGKTEASNEGPAGVRN